MSFWPNKGDADPAPGVWASRIGGLAAVAPKLPAVPETAPGALRLTVV